MMMMTMILSPSHHWWSLRHRCSYIPVNDGQTAVSTPSVVTADYPAGVSGGCCDEKVSFAVLTQCSGEVVAVAMVCDDDDHDPVTLTPLLVTEAEAFIPVKVTLMARQRSAHPPWSLLTALLASQLAVVT
jgi:hypothetical protein